MAYSTKLRIPRSYHEGFIRLLSLGEADFVSLADSLESAIPTLYRGDLASFVAGKVPLDKDAIEEIIQLLVALYQARSIRSIGVPEFVDNICEALQAEDKPEQLKPSDGEWGVFKTRLQRLMSMQQSLGVTSKAFDVMSQHGHTYVNPGTRVLTDIRPVFSDDLGETPGAAVVIHTLKIVYHEGPSHKEFFVAMDINDVRELRDLLNRADKKDHMIRSILQETPMKYLDPEIH